MAAGLPGAGIGGLFYLTSAIALPVRHLWRRLRGTPVDAPLRDSLVPAGIALGILGGIAFTGWALGFLLPGRLSATSALAAAHGVSAAAVAHPVLRAAAIAAGLLTMALVLGTVELAHLLVRPARVEREVLPHHPPTDL